MILDLLTNYETLNNLKIEFYNDDGIIEKLIRKFSAIMMILLSSIFAISQLIGSKIKCWCPKEYSDYKCEYANAHCYITNFYIPLSNSSELPRREYLQSHKINYYQWIPFIFFLQGVVFYLPSMIWRWLYSKTGFDLDDCFKRLGKDNSDQNDSKEIKYVTSQIEKAFMNGNNNCHKNKIFNNGYYLTFCYLLTKIIYLSSIFFQLYIFNKWFNDEYYNETNWIFGSHLFNLENRFPRNHKKILFFLI